MCTKYKFNMSHSLGIYTERLHFADSTNGYWSGGYNEMSNTVRA